MSNIKSLLLGRDLALISIIFAFIVGPYLIAGATFLPLDIPSVVRTGTQGHQTPPQRNYTIDAIGSADGDLAWSIYTARTMRRGEIPFWNPYQGLGAPFLAEGGTAVLYPPNLIRLMLPAKYWDVLNILHFALACFFVYLLAAEVGASGCAAIGASAAMLSNGFYIGYLPTNAIIETNTWFPLLIYGAEKALRSNSTQGSFLPIFASVFFIGTGGHPGPALFIILGFLSYVIIRTAGNRHIWKTAVLLAVPCTLGAMLAAPVWFEEAQFVLSNQDFFKDYSLLVARWFQLPAIVWPYVLGPLHVNSLFEDSRSAADYFGWITPGVLFLALAGALQGWFRRDRTIISLSLVCCLFLMWALDLPPFSFAKTLPILHRLNTAYVFGVPGVLLCVLAGWGIQSLAIATRREWHVWLLAWIALQIGILVCLVLAVRNSPPIIHWDYLEKGPLPNLIWVSAVPALLYILAWGKRPRRQWLIPAAVLALVMQAMCYFPSAGAFAEGSYRVWLAISFVMFVGLICIADWERPSMYAATVGVAVTGIVALGLFVVARYPGWPERSDPSTPPAFVQWLRTTPKEYRTYGIEGVLMPNWGSAFDLPMINFLGALASPESASFFLKYLDQDQMPNQFYGANFAAPRYEGESPLDQFAKNRKAWNYAAVRYIAAPDIESVNKRLDVLRLRRVFFDAAARVGIWENPEADPRLYLAPAAATNPKEKEALDTLSEKIDWRNTAIFQRDDKTPCGAGEPGSSANRMTLIKYMLTPNRVFATVIAKTSGTLVFLDTYAPGWRATINGVAANVHRVDGTFRGVCLNVPGKYEVELIYEPPLWRASLIACGCAFVVLLLLVFKRTFGWRSASCYDGVI